ncbi:MAG: chorismate mutase [Candidatus Thermofonsia Clade 1 bacterium]|uniref:chorismate mutase n=1 Tax=Candidatus Thermofonsia Clade 1 bacterium TaxID=2364210 RepID=A0A2M8PD38_9CHLR|nr:MAG: chorismate mutase [Candidatus Thermofonsia Clade 1 bacterium]PJF43312.1 MAG: chorismate mutase [Candidatus Thermofonsia Clade 1 bacterium]RMF49104.1 MAG: chorismate mutase [Chloroflexota bacterium]
MVCRGIRGATTADANTAEAILSATRELLIELIRRNDLRQEDIASVIFTTTPDLTAEYPALAARQLGWHEAALMCMQELDVPHGLRRCIRVLIHWNTARSLHEIQHVYIRGAVNLRPDRSIELPEAIQQIQIPDQQKES